MVVEAPPASPFIVTETDLLLQILIVTLDAPPEFRDVDQVCESLTFVDGVCAGDERGGAAARAPMGQRFGFLKAPRSTMLQPGPVHGGVTTDPARQLEHLLERFVG